MSETGSDALAELKETEDRLRALYVRARRDGWPWQSAGAVLCLGGGVFAATFGTLLSVLARVRGGALGAISMHGVGSVLLLSTIPLLVLGAHCLDLLERRMERSTARGLLKDLDGDQLPVAAVGRRRAARRV